MRQSFGETAADISKKLGGRESVLRQIVCFPLPQETPDPLKGKLMFLDARRVQSADVENDSDAESGG